MSEPKLISPMLDRFVMGGPISNHDGVRCCPAMEKDSDNRYIVKVISVPASQKQLDALLLSGAYATQDEALAYYKMLADNVVNEVQTLEKLASLDGFVAFDDMQVEPMEDGTGYDIYTLGAYKRSLTRHFVKEPMTHLGALNLGLDMCAALAVCRRSGYLYANLKPNNIFVTGDNEFRIGDLGFIRLDSLKYTSLPDKYRSQYTAPEIKDAFSSLNATIDVYAIGLILYQVYNGGTLPFSGESAPEEAFTAPLYADYELAEIILKACSPEPAERWQDPMEMGQALVSYMQRNGANNTPIVPPAPAVEDNDTETAEEQIVEALNQSEETVQDTSASEESPAYAEDELGNISFLLDESDETAPGEEDTAIDYDNVSEEVSDILTQVDELASHPVPDPVVAPDPVEIPMPEPIVTDDEAQAEPFEEAEEAEETAENEETQDSQDTEEEKETAPAEGKKRSTGHWLRNTLIVVLILAVLSAGVFYYINYYLQSIESITLDGAEDSLTVYVDSEIDEKLLSVICADPHGNQIVERVENGKAVFTNLVPDTAYTVKIVTESFHKLTGDTAKAYSTPIQTNIVQFNAVTGSESGSAILSFTVDGPDSDQWSVVYWAEGEEEKTEVFPPHMVTLTGLTVGKEYHMRLQPQSSLYITGTDEIVFTAAELVYAQNLMVTGCVNNTLTAIWDAPEDNKVETWTVRCYNDDYNETIITSENKAVFDGLDHTQSFTVEVTAAEMSVNQRVFVPENSVTVDNFVVEAMDHSSLKLSWNASQEIPKDGWQLSYTVDGSDLEQAIVCTENSAVVNNLLPGAVYEFTIRNTDGSVALGTPATYVAPGESTFSCEYDGCAVTSNDMTFSMCRTPGWKHWDRYDLDADDYTTEFTAGTKASFLIHLNAKYGYSDDAITAVFAIRNSENQLISILQSTDSWNDMWYGSYCELDIPELPSAPGTYTLELFFNGGLAHQQDFTITE